MNTDSYLKSYVKEELKEAEECFNSGKYGKALYHAHNAYFPFWVSGKQKYEIGFFRNSPFWEIFKLFGNLWQFMYQTGDILEKEAGGLEMELQVIGILDKTKGKVIEDLKERAINLNFSVNEQNIFYLLKEHSPDYVVYRASIEMLKNCSEQFSNCPNEKLIEKFRANNEKGLSLKDTELGKLADHLKGFIESLVNLYTKYDIFEI